MLYNTTFKHSKLNICGVYYCCIINGISKNDAVNLLQILILLKKEEYYKNKKIKKLITIDKMSKEIIYNLWLYWSWKR